MRRAALLLGALAAFRAAGAAAQAPLPTVTPAAGLVITRSVRLAPGTWRLPAPDSTPLITIRGHGITVVLDGVVLEGTDPHADPDLAHGTALFVDGGADVTVRGGTLRGYKVGLLARGTRRLALEGIDASHGWKPRLYSGVEHESLADWLSFHHDERDEWLRYGAAFYLADVQGGTVHGTRARQGMNGLLLVRTSGLTAWNNDFSFNSGLGIGLYRSSGNRILHNRADWCVRGYSHGFYARGQDSAALLLFEQSSRNVVAYNSMTHSGDGLFLWAGQQTMDSGTGGSNDNLFYANDFSYAPTNGMEATFSRNRFVGNVVVGATHGLWGGYSWGSEVTDNRFGGNRIAIAIEHGQDNRIARNAFDGDSTAIRLWWNRIEPGDWGYPKHRDTRSRDYLIEDNRFAHHRVGLRVIGTQRATVRRNAFAGVDTLVVASGDTSGWRWEDNPVRRAPEAVRTAPRQRAPLVPRIRGAWDARLPDTAARGRDRIIVDEWGPYDWRAPKLWPAGRSDAAPLALRVLGPAGRWRVRSTRGVASLSDSAGATGDTLMVTPAEGARDDWAVTLEYAGAAVVTAAGDSFPAGSAVPFGYAHFAPDLRWRVRAAAWDSTADPRRDSTALARAFAGTPLLDTTVARLDWMWYRPAVKALPSERWLLAADGEVTLPPGDYALRTISDDALRLWVDDSLVVDRWAPHESVVDEVPIPAGRHRLRLAYYQVDGWVELRAEVVRRGNIGDP